MAEKPPCEYFRTVFIQCETKEPKLGNITDIEILKENLRVNCIPENIVEMDAAHYEGIEFHCNLYFRFFEHGNGLITRMKTFSPRLYLEIFFS